MYVHGSTRLLLTFYLARREVLGVFYFLFFLVKLGDCRGNPRCALLVARTSDPREHAHMQRSWNERPRPQALLGIAGWGGAAGGES